MCVVATYVIMHVIVYFGVCKCHGCSNNLCKWMFNLVMQPCPYKCVYNVVVLYATPSHNTHILLAATVCVTIGLRTHFWLQTCLTRTTHILLYWTVSVLLSQHKQFISVNRMPYIAHTLNLADHFFCYAQSQTIHPSEPYVVYRTHLHLAACFFCSSSSQTVKWTEPYALHRTHNLNLNCVWCILHRKCFAPFLTVFWHHRLRLWHRTQFRQRVSNRSVALEASCSSEGFYINTIASPMKSE